MTKIRVGVIFGGRSGEHEISLVSASAVMTNFDPKKYNITQIGITKDGAWITGDNVLQELKSGSYTTSLPVLLSTDPGNKGLVVIDPQSQTSHTHKIDVFFPILHGPLGEDGTIQGVFEMMDIPYVGNGVLASSIAMDKVIFKQLMSTTHTLQTPYIWFYANEWHAQKEKIISRIKKLTFPVFVKPANMGSSIGISYVKNNTGLTEAIQDALQYDNKILVEQSVTQAREIEVSILGDTIARASTPGEIISSNDFYDYHAKYIDGQSKKIIPANITDEQKALVQQIALRAFALINGSGLARVDFLLSQTTEDIYLNEINTMPGFTSISMYPKLWQASGVSYAKLIDQFIDIALTRHKRAIL